MIPVIVGWNVLVRRELPKAKVSLNIARSSNATIRGDLSFLFTGAEAFSKHGLKAGHVFLWDFPEDQKIDFGGRACRGNSNIAYGGGGGFCQSCLVHSYIHTYVRAPGILLCEQTKRNIINILLFFIYMQYVMMVASSYGSATVQLMQCPWHQ